MDTYAQLSVVALIVACATGYSALKLMPAAWRRGIAASAARWATRSGLSEITARRVEAKLSSGGACGSCDSCKACATPVAQPDAEPAASSTYRAIPIRQIP